MNSLEGDKIQLVWDKFSDYLYRYGDLQSARKISERRADKFPDERSTERFARRFAWRDLDVITKKELFGPREFAE